MDNVRSPEDIATFPSRIFSGWIVLGLGARGNDSDPAVFGPENAESGNLGRSLGPLRRRPTPGEGGTGNVEVIGYKGEG